MQSIIVPLVKNKAGDLSNLNNYRAIALSPVLSKLFEGVLARFLGLTVPPSICRFSNCSKAVKLKLFQSFCLCFYDIVL